MLVHGVRKWDISDSRISVAPPAVPAATLYKVSSSQHSAKYPRGTQESVMLHYAIVFLVIALIAGALGFFGIAGAAVGIAKILFFVFLLVWVVIFFFGRRAI